MKKSHIVSNSSAQQLGRRTFLRGALIGGSSLAMGMGTFLAGCGGGSSVSNIPGKGGDGGGGDNGDPVDAVAAIEAVGAFVEAFGNEVTPQEANQRVFTFLKGRPEVRDARINPETGVSASFKDGSPFVFINNRFRDTEETNLTTTRSSVLPITRAENDSLPKNLRAFCLTGLGTYMTEKTASISSWLSESGYTLAQSSTLATLENLRGITGAGIVYLTMHGGNFGLKEDASDHYYVLTTATRITPETESDAVIKQELKDGLIIRTVAKLDKRFGGWLEAEEVGVYAITYRFIERYMSLGENSLVYIDACTSDDDLIRMKFFDKGASVYGGWSATALNSLANRNAVFIFDRLMGINEEPNKEEINQRPFDYASIYTDLKKRGWHISPGGGGYAPAEFVFHINGRNPDFSLLNPSIKFMNVSEEKATLTLTGIFGHDKGTVTIGGTEIAIQSWKPDEIVCSLPMTGGGSAGDVQVKVRQHKSNVRQLTEWKTTIKYELDGPGELDKHMEFEVRWRADIQSYRDNAGDEPKFREVPFEFTTDSRGSARGNGSHTVNNVKYSWSGEQLLPYIIGDNEVPDGSKGFFGNGTIKPEQGKIALLLGGSGVGGGTSKIEVQDKEPINLQFSSFFPMDKFLPDLIQIPIEKNGTVPSFDKSFATVADPFGNLSATGRLYFGRIEPQAPPSEEASRKR
jgi:hypothetical protein